MEHDHAVRQVGMLSVLRYPNGDLLANVVSHHSWLLSPGLIGVLVHVAVVAREVAS
jgi:hypothetical protein